MRVRGASVVVVVVVVAVVVVVSCLSVGANDLDSPVENTHLAQQLGG